MMENLEIIAELLHMRPQMLKYYSLLAIERSITPSWSEFVDKLIVIPQVNFTIQMCAKSMNDVLREQAIRTIASMCQSGILIIQRVELKLCLVISFSLRSRIC
jgi:hypothetical protein